MEELSVQCPMCEADTKVDGSRDAHGGVRRRRVCKRDASHRFFSLEKLEGWRLDDIAIRQSGGTRFQGWLFDKERLFRDVEAGVIRLLSDAEIREVVRGIVEQLRDDLPDRAKPITDEIWDRRELNRSPHMRPQAYIWDTEVREVVENQLSLSKNRVPHLLYAMSFRGRPVAHRKGWQGAEDVLIWLSEKYPDLVQREEIPTHRPATVTWKWRPTEPAPDRRPKYVLKAGRLIATTSDGSRVTEEDLEVRAGRLVAFDKKRFIESIRLALLGRGKPRWMADAVAWWVLTDLQGQERVHSAQLAIGVLDCLRRIDDIAYLRWAAHVKSFPQVRNFKSEALGLITHPSDQLKFDSNASPRKSLTIVGNTSDSD